MRRLYRTSDYESLISESRKVTKNMIIFFASFVISALLIWFTYKEYTNLVLVAVLFTGWSVSLFGLAATYLDKSRIDFALDTLFVIEEEEEEEGSDSDSSGPPRFSSAFYVTPARLAVREGNVTRMGKFELLPSDWGIIYTALANSKWYWNKKNVLKAKRNDGSYVIPGLSGSAFPLLENEFRELGFFDTPNSRMINDHGRAVLAHHAGIEHPPYSS